MTPNNRPPLILAVYCAKINSVHERNIRHTYYTPHTVWMTDTRAPLDTIDEKLYIKNTYYEPKHQNNERKVTT